MLTAGPGHLTGWLARSSLWSVNTPRLSRTSRLRSRKGRGCREISSASFSVDSSSRRAARYPTTTYRRRTRSILSPLGRQEAGDLSLPTSRFPTRSCRSASYRSGRSCKYVPWSGPHGWRTGNSVSAQSDGTPVEKDPNIKLSYPFCETEYNLAPPLSPLLSPADTRVYSEHLDPAYRVLDCDTTTAGLLPFTEILLYLDATLKTLSLHTAVRNDFITYCLPEVSKKPFVALHFLPQAAYGGGARCRAQARRRGTCLHALPRSLGRGRKSRHVGDRAGSRRGGGLGQDHRSRPRRSEREPVESSRVGRDGGSAIAFRNGEHSGLHVLLCYSFNEVYSEACPPGISDREGRLW